MIRADPRRRRPRHRRTAAPRLGRRADHRLRRVRQPRRRPGRAVRRPARRAGRRARLRGRRRGGRRRRCARGPRGRRACRDRAAGRRARSSSYVLAADADGAGAGVLAGLAALARHVVDTLRSRSDPGLASRSSASPARRARRRPRTSPRTCWKPPARPSPRPGRSTTSSGTPGPRCAPTPETRHLVLELSARGPGHVAALCRVAPPRIGVVLNVGSAHLGEFGSREAIAQAKGELVEALPG